MVELLSLTGYGGFLLATFGRQTWRAVRRSGDSRWRWPVSRADAVGESLCLAACTLSLSAGPLAVAGLARPLTGGWAPGRVLLGVACLGLGTALALAAQRHLAGDWTAGVEPSAALVADGPYAKVRNPFYVGCFLASGAVLLWVPTAVALAGFGLHVAAAEIVVRWVEEPVLARAHGEAYRVYAGRRGRFLPCRPRS